jgi:hypothetical protein
MNLTISVYNHVGTATAAAAGGAALAAYLNAKFHLAKDLSSLVASHRANKTYGRAGTDWRSLLYRQN